MTDDVKAPTPRRSFVDRISLWVGLTGSLVTVVLTIWNAYTKMQIDRREEDLRALELALKTRAAGVEESKERVDRYKWVLSLFTDLSGPEQGKRNFTVSLVRLALTPQEAEQLFSGLQVSTDKSLQSVGQSGLTAIAVEPIAQLIAQMNAATPTARKTATAELIRRYGSSSQAVDLALGAFAPERIDALSQSAVINVLYFLAATDPSAWSPSQVATGRQVIARVQGRTPGTQTQTALQTFSTLLGRVPNAP